MAEAFRCDRCQGFEEGEPVREIKWVQKGIQGTSSVGQNRKAELCMLCADQFHRFIDNHHVDSMPPPDDDEIKGVTYLGED